MVQGNGGETAVKIEQFVVHGATPQIVLQPDTSPRPRAAARAFGVRQAPDHLSPLQNYMGNLAKPVPQLQELQNASATGRRRGVKKGAIFRSVVFQIPLPAGRSHELSVAWWIFWDRCDVQFIKFPYLRAVPLGEVRWP